MSTPGDASASHVNFDKELAIDMVINTFPPCCNQSNLAYHLNITDTILALLHNLLHTESGMKMNQILNPSSALVLSIGQNKGKQRKVAPKLSWNYKAHGRLSINSP